MCEFCRQYPCNASCPYNDIEIATSCDICGWAIVKGDIYYEVDGNEICENCISGYLASCCHEEPTAITCDICGDSICENVEYHSIEGNNICENCIDDYITECNHQA